MRTKPNTFLDGIACAQYLIENGYTSPKKIAVTGTSAGGIFGGGSHYGTPRPVRRSTDTRRRVGHTADGNHRRRTGKYPRVRHGQNAAGTQGIDGDESIPPNERRSCVPGSAADDRIQRSAGYAVGAWEDDGAAAGWHSSSGKPVLLRVDYDAGHGLGSTRLQGVKEWADDFAFLLWQLGEKDFRAGRCGRRRRPHFPSWRRSAGKRRDCGDNSQIEQWSRRLCIRPGS